MANHFDPHTFITDELGTWRLEGQLAAQSNDREWYGTFTVIPYVRFNIPDPNNVVVYFKGKRVGLAVIHDGHLGPYLKLLNNGEFQF